MLEENMNQIKLRDNLIYEPIVLKPSIKQYFSSTSSHQRLLEDKIRLAAFKKAIYEVVKPGDVVMDIGAGTGVLTRFALEAGASMVYAIEENSDILEIARENPTIKRNKEKVHMIPLNSKEVPTSYVKSLPDVIISETLGSLAFNEGILSNIHDAKRFFKPTTVVIPETIRLMLSPCRYVGAIEEKAFFLYENKNEIILSDQTYCILEVKLNSSFPLNFHSTTNLTFSINAFDWLCLWFEADLSKKQGITTSSNNRKTSWGQGLINISTFSDFNNLQITIHHVAKKCNHCAVGYLFSCNGFELFQRINGNETINYKLIMEAY